MYFRSGLNGLVLWIFAAFFLASCGSSSSESEDQPIKAMPAEGASGATAKPQVLSQCEGENFVGDVLSRFKNSIVSSAHSLDGPYNPTTDGALEKLSLGESSLETMYRLQNNQLTLQLIDSEVQEQLLSVTQNGFLGFMQIALRQGERGGWADCRGKIQELKKIKVFPRLLCRGFWRNSKGVQDFFILPLHLDTTSSDEIKSIDFESSGGDQYLFRAQENHSFLSYQVVDQKNQQEVGSVLTDHFFQEHRVVMWLDRGVFEFHCQSEE